MISIPTVQNLKKMEVVIKGSNSQPIMGEKESGLDSTLCQEDNSRAGNPRYKGPLKVYTRRKVPTTATPTTHEHSSSASQEAVDVSSTPETEIEDSTLDDLPIALRKGPRAKAGVPPSMYGFEHDIGNYVSYASLSPAYRSFIASLQSIVIPKDWKEANQDPKWREAMLVASGFLP